MDADTLLRANDAATEMAKSVRGHLGAPRLAPYKDFFRELILEALCVLSHAHNRETIDAEDVTAVMLDYIDADASVFARGYTPKTFREMLAGLRRAQQQAASGSRKRPKHQTVLADLTAHAGTEAEYDYVYELACHVLDPMHEWWSSHIVEAKDLEVMMEFEPETDEARATRLARTARIQAAIKRHRNRTN